MADKNDVSAYLKGSQGVLAGARPRSAGKGVRKSASEKRSHKILLSVTEGEGTILKEKAGLVPVATYLVELLRTHGVFDPD